MNELLIAFGQKPFIPPSGTVQKHKMSDDDNPIDVADVSAGEVCPYKEKSRDAIAWRIDYILRIMADRQTYTADAIAAKTGIDRKKIHFTLMGMCKQGLIQKSEPEAIGAHIPYLYWFEPSEPEPKADKPPVTGPPQVCICCGELKERHKFATGENGHPAKKCHKCYRNK